MTLAASTSKAARGSDSSTGRRSRGLGSVWSFGSQVEISSLAREKFGCRERVVKVSAHERVRESASVDEMVAGLGPDRRGGFELRDWQHPPSGPLPPQHPDGAALPDREAASDLQKRVLLGSERH